MFYHVVKMIFVNCIHFITAHYFPIYQTFKRCLRPAGLQPHQMRPQDYGEVTLDTLHKPAKQYMTDEPPPYHLHLEINVRCSTALSQHAYAIYSYIYRCKNINFRILMSDILLSFA